MNKGLLAEQQTVFIPAGLLVTARIANMVVSLGMIPILIHFLGGEGFAAWAVLLAMSAAFSVLEIGMPLTFVKHAAPLIQQGNWTQVNAVLSQAAGILCLAFVIAAPAVGWFAGIVARELHLPDGDWMSAAQMIVFVYTAVALRGLLQFGASTFNAARRFRALAAVSFLQSFVSNCSASVAAIWTGRVEVTLVAYWISQFVMLALTFLVARRLYIGRLLPPMPRLSDLRELVSHGLKIQIYECAQIINFQFDKFLIASFMGLWAIAPYEVANRSVLALRSIPASGLDSFLASAAIERQSGVNIWPRYHAATKLAATAVMIFMIAPLAIAPVFLYAWTGQMGYVARWVFLCLLLGAAGGVLTLPAAAMAQAAGRADIQARSALVSMLTNIPLSIILVLEWGLAGAAAGTSIAMLTGAALLLINVHRTYQKPLSETLKILWQFWPLLVVCLACGALVYFPFEYWMATLDPVTRYSREMRVVPGLMSGAAYVMCLTLMAAVQIHRGALSREQYDLLSKWIRFKWFVEYCATRTPREPNLAA